MNGPKLSAIERQNVRDTLRRHPRILTQVANLSEIVRLKKNELFKVSSALGISLDKAKTGAYLAALDQGQAGWDNLPFEGAFELDVDITIAGATERRTLIIDYEFAPEWPYLDIKTGLTKHVCEEFSLNFFLTGYERRTKGGAAPEPRRIPRKASYRDAVNIRQHFEGLFDEDLIISIKNWIENDAMERNAAAVEKMTSQPAAQAG